MNEELFVGFIKNEPVVIGILCSIGEASNIFSLITKENMRSLGYSSDMIKYLLKFASNRANYTTLSASSNDGYRIYECLGFKLLGLLNVLSIELSPNEDCDC